MRIIETKECIVGWLGLPEINNMDMIIRFHTLNYKL